MELWVSIHGGHINKQVHEAMVLLLSKLIEDPVTLKLIAEDQQPAKTLNNNSGEEWSEVGKNVRSKKKALLPEL